MNENDLHWLAFQYIADELSSDECEEFEIRLLSDQDAREAVARSVEIALAVRHCQPSARPAGSPGRKWVWAAVCAVSACLAFMMLGHVIPSSSPEETNPIASESDDDAVKLANAWSEIRELSASEPMFDPVASGTADIDSEVLDATVTTDEVAVEPPSWMVVALADLSQQE